MKPEIISIISALGGISIGMIGNLIVSLISKRFEYRRELKKLLCEISLSAWKERNEHAKTVTGSVYVAPLSNDLIFYSYLFQFIDKGKFEEADFKRIMDVSEKLSKMTLEYTIKANH